METAPEPQDRFQQWVVDKLRMLEVYHTNHLAHHETVYKRLWGVALIMIGAIAGLYFR